MKKILTAMLLLLGLQAWCQQTVVTVHTTGGNETECVLGQSGAIYFTAQGEQIAVKDEAGVVRGFGLGMVEKVTFSEKTAEPESISEAEQPTLVAYPNPTASVIHIDHATGPVSLYDLAGHPVMESLQSTLDLTALPAGVYFLRSNGQTLKIAKQ